MLIKGALTLYNQVLSNVTDITEPRRGQGKLDKFCWASELVVGKIKLNRTFLMISDFLENNTKRFQNTQVVLHP